MRPWALQVKPRNWQIEALGLWEEQYRGIVSVVTGGGKTVFAEMCMANFRERYPNGRYIVVVPTITLLDQWYVSLQEDLAIPVIDISCFSGEEKPKEPNIVNILVINTAREVAPKIADNYDTFLIVDECHRAGSKVNSKALAGQNFATLGLSATPEREYDEGFQNYVVPKLGNVIYHYSYTNAYKDGAISQFDLINTRVEMLVDEQEKYNKLSKRIAIESDKISKGTVSGDRIKYLLQKRANIAASAVMRIPVSAKLVEQHRGKRTIVFHERIEAANLIFDLLVKRNHSATIYHSGIGPTVRRDNLRLYRRGVFDVLVCCRALDEGMNVPETTVAIIASSTASYRQRIQRLGRVLRPAPGKKNAIIYTIFATDQEEKRLLREAKNLEDIASVSWYRSSLNKNGKNSLQ